MFRVAANMNETYYGEDVQQRKSNLVSFGDFLRFFGESYPECCCSPHLQNPHQGRKGGERAEKRAGCRSLPTALPNGPMS